MFLNLSGKTHCLSNREPILQQISGILLAYQTSIDNFSFFANGKLLQSFQHLPCLTTISALVPLKGGKGGYGAKLKTEGGKKVRPNDNMFSRDTHGQRVVYATMQKDYKEFVRKKIEEDKLVAKERQQFKIMESTLKQGQSFMKLDQAYKKEIETTEKNLTESIMIGKQKLMERYKLEQKMAKAEVAQHQENGEVKQEEEKACNQQVKQDCVKRTLPADFKQQVTGQPQKKQKVEEQKSLRPVFLSAQQRFKLLFKK